MYDKRFEISKTKWNGGGNRTTDLTKRSVEHCTPHADGAWLNELWLVTVVIKYNSCIFMVKLRNLSLESKIENKHQHEIIVYLHENH